jgi:RNA polymerase sigma factor (sigma-70 family)
MFVEGPSSGDGRDRVPYAELQNLSDERLVQEIQKGNTDGFAVTFKRYHRLVHVTALKIVRDASEAEDLTQTVFLEIYRRLGQFDPARGTLKVWLLQFAYSRSIHRRNYLFVRRFHNQVQLSEAERQTSRAGQCESRTNRGLRSSRIREPTKLSPYMRPCRMSRTTPPSWLWVFRMLSEMRITVYGLG